MLVKNKKGISAVVAITLLLVMAVFAVVSFQGWYKNYQSTVFADTEQKGSVEVLITGISGFIGENLYFINGEQENLTITEIEVVCENGSNPSVKIKKPCGISRSIGRGMHTITLNNGCLNDTSEKKVEILVHTNEKIFSKNFIAKGNSGTTVVLGGPCVSIAPEGFAGGDGTFADPWQICSCDQLQNMSNYLGGNFTITQNIDCSETSTWNAGAGFFPISSYTGMFDGGNYDVDQLYINRGGTNYIGLFGQVTSTAIVQNIGLTNVNITGNQQVGGIVGRNNQGIVNTTHVNGNVQGSSYVGGLVGYNYGSVDNSYSAAIVSASIWSAGGLVGKNYHGSIDNSYNTGDVSSSSYLAGVVGYDYYGSIDNCYNTAYILASGSNAGGLVGSAWHSSMDNSYNTGNVQGTSYIGGLAGSWPNSNIDNSYNTGNVQGTSYIGGLVGKFSSGVAYNVSNAGLVNGSADRVGGLLGMVATGSINKAYNEGTVIGGTSRIGGFVGWADNVKINDSYSSGSVTGESYVGGFIGYLRIASSYVNNTYATGNVVGNNTVGGFAGWTGDLPVTNSYSTGSVTGVSVVGGFVGNNTDATFTNSYWNNHAGNPGTAIAYDENAQTINAIADNEAYFYNSGNAPMSSWSAVWDFSGSAHATLS